MILVSQCHPQNIEQPHISRISRSLKMGFWDVPRGVSGVYCISARSTEIHVSIHGDPFTTQTGSGWWMYVFHVCSTHMPWLRFKKNLQNISIYCSVLEIFTEISSRFSLLAPQIIPSRNLLTSHWKLPLNYWVFPFKKLMIFHSYVNVYQGGNHHKTPFNHHFPMLFPRVFLWFSGDTCRNLRLFVRCWFSAPRPLTSSKGNLWCPSAPTSPFATTSRCRALWMTRAR